MAEMRQPSAEESLRAAGPLERRSLSEVAADRLRELILLEKLAPGTPVPERELAEALGVSRTPLKEALRRLEVEGLVEYSPTRRPRVADPTIDELAQSLSVLGALEALGGEQAATIGAEEEIARIVAMADAMKRSQAQVDELEFFRQDMDFHRAIVAAAKNTPLQRTHESFNARLFRARFLSSRQADRRDNTLREHDAIASALARRDAKATASALRAHLDSATTNIRRALNRTGGSK